MSVRPQWIAKMYAGKVGRDHLGLGSVSSDQILPLLSPAINVLTIYPRYHSFYCFLLDEFWRRDRTRNTTSWAQFYRARDFIFSLGVFLCDQPEHASWIAAVGKQKTLPLARQGLPTYDTTTNYIKNELGGYGLYYRSVMAELGLIYPGGPGFPYPVDVPTERGKEVADAFRQAVQHTAYYHEYFEHDATEVPTTVIQEYIRHACLCQLQVSSAPDRPLLLDIFLHHGTDELASARRNTFRLLLDIAAQTDGVSIDQDAFRQLLYFQAAENRAVYRPQSQVEPTYRRWRLYQAREYYSFALNALWKYLCTWGIERGGDAYPVSFERIWQHLDETLDFDALARQLGLPQPALAPHDRFIQLLHWLQTVVDSDHIGFDLACTLSSPLHEHRLYRFMKKQDARTPITVTSMVAMLGLLYLRFGLPDRWRQPEWTIARMGQDGRLSFAEFLRSLRQRLEHSGSVSIHEVVRWLYADYIILQHQLVASSKLPDNTFRFQREGNRLRFYRFENRLDFMDSRFFALSTTIHELGLCGDFAQPAHDLTPDGLRLLSEGDIR